MNNIWDNIDIIRTELINASFVWGDDLDSKEKYLKNLKEKDPNKFKTYSDPHDVTYRYNSYGFRTGEIKVGDSCDILALGCSFTEGTGLKEEHIWCNQLGRLLGNKKVINMGTGGCGIEGLGRCAHFAFNVLKLKPKNVVALFPLLYRKEVFLKNLNFAERHFTLFPQTCYFNDKGYFEVWKNYSKTINIKDRVNDLIKEIVLINAFCQGTGSQFLWSIWGHLFDVSDYKDIKQCYLPLYDLNGNKHIDVYDIIDLIAPDIVKKTGGQFRNLFINNEDYISDQDLSPSERFNINIARDFSHPGPNSHLVFAKKVKNILNV